MTADKIARLRDLCDKAITSHCGEAQERFRGAAGPTTVRALLDEVDKLRAENASLKEQMTRLVFATVKP